MSENTGKETRRGPQSSGLVTRAEPVTMVTPTFASSSHVATNVNDREGFQQPGDESERGPQTPAPGQNYSELRYGEKEEIGRGGMGRVYRVLDKDLNRNVAMKVLSCGRPDQDSEFRFVAEAQISGQLEHPALLPIHDIGIDDDGQSFFTMRYVSDHETLDDIIELLRAGNLEAHRTYTMKRRVQIIQRVCDALGYAHARGVVHRDIKPSNILVGSAGEIYVADWGVACLLGQEQSARVPTPVPATGSDESGAGISGAIETNLATKPDDTGKLVGTPLYMSPEQLMANGNISPASDVYCLCAVAYEFLSLTHYLGPNPPSAYLAIFETITDCPHIDAESYVHPIGGRVPRQLSRIFRKGLQKDRSHAFATAAELEEALQRWVEGNAPIVCPGTFFQYWLGRVSGAIDRRPVSLPIVGIGLLALLFACVATTVITIASYLG